MTPPDKQQIGDEADFLDDEEASPEERTGSIGNELRASGPAARRRPTTRRSRQGLSRSKPPARLFDAAAIGIGLVIGGAIVRWAESAIRPFPRVLRDHAEVLFLGDLVFAKMGCRAD